MEFVDYRKREFCNDVKCPVQMEMNKHTEGSPEHGAIRGICASACLQSSRNFVDWLDDHGFVIVKNRGEDPSAHRKAVEQAIRKESTAWLFHRAINSDGLIVVKMI